MTLYYIDRSVLVEIRPLLKLIRNYIRDSSSVFSISSLVRISMKPFPLLQRCLGKVSTKTLLSIQKKKITGQLKTVYFIFSW